MSSTPPPFALQADRCTSPKATQRYVTEAVAAGGNATFLGLPDTRHLIFHEPNRRESMTAMAAWVDARITEAGVSGSEARGDKTRPAAGGGAAVQLPNGNGGGGAANGGASKL